MKRTRMIRILLSLLLCLTMVSPALADVLKLPDGVKVIEKEAFYGDTSLDEVVLPEGIEEIGERAFAESSVTRINLPDSLDFIAEDAFDADADIRFSANDPSYAYDWLEAHGYSGDEPESPVTDFVFADNGDGTCAVREYIGSAENVVIPRKNGKGQIVTKIGYKAFYTCKSITSITIPDSVTSIGYNAFGSCTSLSSITIPDGVTSIGDWAFSNCSSLSNVTIPDSVTSIGYRAFYTCISLTSITIPGSVTSIGEFTFDACISLSSITIPDSVTSIGYCAFQGCHSLSSITIPDSVTSIGRSAFESCTSLSSITIGDSVTSIGDCAFRFCTRLSSITIGDSVTSIGDYAFDNCTSLSSITIPDSVTSIGNGAFLKCYYLSSITIGNSVTSIGYDAFKSCTRLSSITIPDSVTSIGNMAFCTCSGLTSITIPGSVTSIGSEVFSNCESLASVTIAYGVTSIGAKAFTYCDSLSSITIAESVTSIENSAFEGCFRLKQVYCVENSYVWQWFAKGRYGRYYELIECYDNTPVDELASVVSVEYGATSIEVGTELEFTVTARNAWKVQLIVDDEYYEEYWLDNDSTHKFRKITLAGDRKVAFRAYGYGGWSRPSAITTIHVSSSGQLDTPEATWSETVYAGKPQILTWNMVENADDYRLYLNHPNGQIDRIEPQDMGDAYVPGDENTPYRYSFDADTFDTNGSWSVRLMAYGKGYSQSSVLCSFTVTDTYEPWEGWVQAERADVYETEEATDANGLYVDYIDPVTVKGETANGRYWIIMKRTEGNYVDRYVDKVDIGTEPYSPSITLSCSYTYGAERLKITATTNLVAVSAGIKDTDGRQLKTLFEHTRKISTYRKAYDFSLPIPTDDVAYTIWANDGTETKEVTLTVNPPLPSSTPSPEETETPGPDPTETPSPEPTESPIPEPTAVYVDPSVPEPDPGEDCDHTSLETLENFVLVADKDGIFATGATCKICGGPVNCKGNNVAFPIGFEIDSIGLYKYYHNDNSSSAIGDFSIQSITFDLPLEINKDTDFNGAALYVNDKLTVKAKMTNVASVSCKKLEVANGGGIYAQRYVYTDGGDITVKAGGIISAPIGIMAGNAHSLQVDLNIHPDYHSSYNIFNAYISGHIISSELDAEKITIYDGAHVEIADIYCGNDLIVKGSTFQYDGTVHIYGKVQMDNTDDNYIKDIIFTRPIISLDKNNKAVMTYDISQNTAMIKGTVQYFSFDETARKYAREKIWTGIKEWIGSNLSPDNNNFYNLYKQVKDYFTTFLTNEKVDKDKVKSILGSTGFNGETKETVAGRWPGQMVFPSMNVPDINAYTLAVKVGLMEEMFFVGSTHTFKLDSGCTISLDKIKNLQEQSFNCNNEKWYIDVDDTSLRMSVTVKANGDTQNVSLDWLRGTIRKETDQNAIRWEFLPSNYTQVYNGLMAAGFSEISHQLESAAKNAISYLTDMLKDITGLDDLNLKGKLWSKIDSTGEDLFGKRVLWQYRYAEAVQWQRKLSEINEELGDFNEDLKMFNFFKDMYDKVKLLQTNTITNE